MYRVKMLRHDSGERIPILLDEFDLPLILPNEYILCERAKDLASSTLERKLRSIARFCQWERERKINFYKCLLDGNSLSESLFRTSLVDYLRLNKKNAPNEKGIVSAGTFNTSLMHVIDYIDWVGEKVLFRISDNESRYDRTYKTLQKVIQILTNCYRHKPPRLITGKSITDEQFNFLLSVMSPYSSENPYRTAHSKFRNHLIIKILSTFGLRPSELLSIKVDDIEFGRYNAIHIVRRPNDPDDNRVIEPNVKRNGRQLMINDPILVTALDEYIVEHRDRVIDSNPQNDNDFLIINNDGKPMSYQSVYEIFERIRTTFSSQLPRNLSPKSLRHYFSQCMTKYLKSIGMEDGKIKEVLMYLRGDSSIESQDEYLKEQFRNEAQEHLIKNQARWLDVN